MRAVAATALLLLCTIGASSAETRAVADQGEEVRYLNPEYVNTSAASQIVARLPLRVYTFKYDSQKGRRQLGVLGHDLAHLIPESVKLMPVQPFPNPDKNGPPIIQLRNFYAVDNNVVFFYNIAATQELIKDTATLESSLNTLNLNNIEELKKVWAAIEADRSATAEA